MGIQKIAQSAGKAIGGIPKRAGNSLGEFFTPSKTGAISRGFGEGLGEGLGLSPNAQQNLGNVAGVAQSTGVLAGLGYLLGPAVKNMTSGGSEKTSASGKVIPKEELKFREKVTKDIMGGLSGDFTPEDFSSRHSASDEGWRAGLKSMKKDDFNAMAKKAVESGNSDDIRNLWNSVIRSANKQGKNVNTSKPLYLPATFNKNGKKMGYAMVMGEDKKARLVPIEMGKGVSFED
jgi:hypothetical protein